MQSVRYENTDMRLAFMKRHNCTFMLPTHTILSAHFSTDRSRLILDFTSFTCFSINATICAKPQRNNAESIL
ncbi:protein of unknown function [Methylocella tundrae]|uniref:Uncharacterized protein n=1 Tax=Methylocella tundrae TaxID=227605 RepID=A0A4U8Z213_METTU|nr:protein of unknown function [Methylocella tundrae]